MGTESWTTVTLAESANLCLESFTKCLARVGHLTVREQSAIEDQLGQFSIWSSNIGIFAAAKNSLDYRLRDAFRVQRLLRRLLRILNDHIQRLLSAINSPPEVRTTLSRPSSSLSEATELDPIIRELADEIDLIHKLSRAIRIVSKESQYLGTSASKLSDNVSGDVKGSRINQSDLEVIQDEFPNWANTSSRRDSDLLEFPPAQPASEAKQDNSSSSSLLSPIVLTFEKPKAQHTLSRLSWADTSSRRDAEHLAFPPAPIESILQRLQTLNDNHIATEKAFLRGNTSYSRGVTPPMPSMFSKGQRDRRGISLMESKRDLEREWSICMEGARNVICPYCYCDLPSSVAMNQKKWSDHVKGDLDLYICLFDRCDSPYKLYNTKDEWLNHMRQHRPRWRCAARAHGVLVFYEKSEYEEHMRRKHKSTQPQLAILAERSSRPSGPVFQSCPLCGEGNRADLEEHIADHLTYLALMSIPLPKSQSTDDHMKMAANLDTDHLRAGGAGRTDSYHSFDESEMKKAGDPSRLPESPFAGLKESKQKQTKGKAPVKDRNQEETHRR
ncbi:uncharacterized protein BO88DRAFT_488420 [Aspergillus vadensis CBS 113365]|uniref:C2H2-type domain-containing protein n=1 Tax=Aspergillus vadensis (strain CBS 113365 / IMI 142717 / IBT 24658) TaxID=1448311 RepID=A0A319B7Y9_ASPVC|nr:hypothetical protein BO88DRAFT_488420 [Aspergillus vadensis CBS 113365]PYH68479.1 hypothetical protein BO88DRAFT_488420 [Aspergillus vadensis CBS 113365]